MRRSVGWAEQMLAKRSRAVCPPPGPELDDRGPRARRRPVRPPSLCHVTAAGEGGREAPAREERGRIKLEREGGGASVWGGGRIKI